MDFNYLCFTLGNERSLLIHLLLRNVNVYYYIFKSSYVMDMNSLEQIFTSCHQGPEKRRSASREGFSLAPEQLKFQSILYWFIDFPEYGKYFIK